MDWEKGRGGAVDEVAAEKVVDELAEAVVGAEAGVGMEVEAGAERSLDEEEELVIVCWEEEWGSELDGTLFEPGALYRVGACARFECCWAPTCVVR